MKKLATMPYAQARIAEYDDGSVTLISYTTDVIHITSDGWLSVTGLYSATTRRHISCFMKERTPFDYAVAKKLYEDNMEINIETAEIRPIGGR